MYGLSSSRAFGCVRNHHVRALIEQTRGRAELRTDRPGRLLATRVSAVSLPNALAGLKTTYETVKDGQGDLTVEKGAHVTVHATGIVKQTGKKFWSTKDPGQQPFQYSAGTGGVITGWDKGCLGMKLGEVRKLDIPAEEGYGARGFPQWGIPAGGGLEFEIEVLKIDQNEL